ncbi:MAG: hypothetical protein RL034_84 [Bacteroidota bacterium]|jgi:hypothetical protein
MRKKLINAYSIIVLLGILMCATTVKAQTDSLLQQLINSNKVDSSLIQPPAKMLFTQRILWGTNGLLKNRYSSNDLVANRQKDLKIRRTMLKLHQIGGFVTLGGMVAQGIVGSQLYKGDYKVKDIHENLGMAVNLTYGFTAINALFSPPSAFQRDKKITSIRLHKWLAVLHLSGMIATNILASQVEHNASLKPYHRAAAYVSFASLATALIVIKF